ncbi:MAG: hypothetical protein J1F36_03255 [Clostridiales bacterium]|nr:hypothetical protein [Clostridiales bacterium]
MSNKERIWNESLIHNGVPLGEGTRKSIKKNVRRQMGRSVRQYLVKN